MSAPRPARSAIPPPAVPPPDAHAAASRGFTVRPYAAADEPSWLRCRVLSFLGTPYYDDVLPAKPSLAPPGFSLVAAQGAGPVLGIVDVAVEGPVATIDTIAVHPDHQRLGMGRALLAETRRRVRGLGIGTLDAWTRDHPDTLRWYRSMGFAESGHYVHVHAADAASPGEADRAVRVAGAGLRPVAAYLHASLGEEARLRAEFTRVYVCRRFALTP